jgi:hypothetical protein
MRKLRNIKYLGKGIFFLGNYPWRVAWDFLRRMGQYVSKFYTFERWDGVATLLTTDRLENVQTLGDPS